MPAASCVTISEDINSVRKNQRADGELIDSVAAAQVAIPRECFMVEDAIRLKHGALYGARRNDVQEPDKIGKLEKWTNSCPETASDNPAVRKNLSISSAVHLGTYGVHK